jgi:hypothetical protein
MQRIQVRPGYVVSNTTRATGGVSYQRTRGSQVAIGDDGIQQDIETRKIVDHVEAVRKVASVAKAADYLCRKTCAQTTFGWYCAPDALSDLRVGFDALRDMANAANDFARSVGSASRVHVGFVPTMIDLGTEDAAREVARTIRETLSDVIEALRSGAVSGNGSENKLRGPVQRAKGLDKLATGLAGDAVRMALESIGPIAREIRDAVKRGESPESAGARMEFGALETALAWVSESGIGGEGATVDLSGADE